MRQIRRVIYLQLAVVLAVNMVIGMPVVSTAAQAASCNVDSLSPHDPPSNDATGFDFALSGTTDMQWIAISAPSPNVSIYDASSNDWTPQISSNQVVFSQGEVSAGTETYLHVVAQIGDYFPSANWSVQVSPNSDGSNPITCGGDASMSVRDTSPPSISSIVASFSGSATTISWTTNKPATSSMIYGPDTTYGGTASDSSYITAHQLTITGLVADTAYHYRVTSVDTFGNTASSDDNTFTTPAPLSQIVLPGGTPLSTTGPTNVIAPANKRSKSADQTPPSISMKGFAKVEKQAPIISGMASDDESVSVVNYSTDNGKDWLPVDTVSGLDTKQTTFAFTPHNLQDGTYQIRVEAIDGSGNRTISAPKMLVIEQYSPQIGGGVISSGPQLLEPDQAGIVRTVTGIEQKITLQALSGATSIILTAKHPGDPRDSNTFQLVQDPDSALWSGVIDFQSPGMYQVTGHDSDGAGVTTSRTLETFSVLPAARVVSSTTGKKITNARATLYYQDSTTGNWVVWDGTAYGEQNPQFSHEGTVNLLLPPGTYYLKIAAKHYKPLISQIFHVYRPLPLVTPLYLQPENHLSSGLFTLAIPDVMTSKLTITPKLSDTVHRSASSGILGEPFPNFSLSSTTGQSMTALNLTGKLSVVSVVSTWSPTTTDQLAALRAVQDDQNINVVPLFEQESLDRVRTYMDTSGYEIPAIADPSGSLVNGLEIGYLPTNYFIDQSGHIKKVVVGVLSKSELLTALVGQ